MTCEPKNCSARAVKSTGNIPIYLHRGIRRGHRICSLQIHGVSDAWDHEPETAKKAPAVLFVFEREMLLPSVSKTPELLSIPYRIGPGAGAPGFRTAYIGGTVVIVPET